MLILYFRGIIRLKIEKEVMGFVRVWLGSYLILLSRCILVVRKGISRILIRLSFKLL